MIPKEIKSGTKETSSIAKEVEDGAKAILKHPVTKVVLVTGGVVALCYASIFAMNLLAKMVTAYKGLDKASKS